MIVILDIETRELIPDNRDLSGMRVSIAGVQTAGGMRYFAEDDLEELFAILDDAELIAGHNLLLFDYKILQRYAGFDVAARYKAKTFDIFSILLQETDRRVSLNDLAQRNLGIAKSGSGSDAPRLFHEGRLDELKEYLAQDLRITGLLVEHIREHGRLKYGHVCYKDPIEREVAIRLPHKQTPVSSA